jgi:hypothetical protein
MRLQHWLLVMLLLFTATGVALSDDLIGQQASSTVTRSKFTAPEFASGASMRPRAHSFVEARTASNIAAARRPQTASTPSSRGGR